MSWTDDRVELLSKLWGEGKTAAEIAKELGGVTRNAVIGKAHRLKLSNRVSPIQQNKKSASTPAKAKPKAANTSVAPVAAPITRKAKKASMAVPTDRDIKPLLEIGAYDCRWPYGDPNEDDFGFCGDKCMTGLPYCGEHAKLAYQAATRNRILKAEQKETQTVTKEELEVAKKALAK